MIYWRIVNFFIKINEITALFCYFFSEFLENFKFYKNFFKPNPVSGGEHSPVTARKLCRDSALPSAKICGVLLMGGCNGCAGPRL
jgi:hypothetical protein